MICKVLREQDYKGMRFNKGGNIDFLTKEIELLGPIRKEWSNSGTLKKDKRIPDNAYHCHVQSGRSTYVVCWRVESKIINIVEIFYVGTHEGTPY
jgi:hypothetical protein